MTFTPYPVSVPTLLEPHPFCVCAGSKTYCDYGKVTPGCLKKVIDHSIREAVAATKKRLAECPGEDQTTKGSSPPSVRS